LSTVGPKDKVRRLESSELVSNKLLTEATLGITCAPALNDDCLSIVVVEAGAVVDASVVVVGAAEDVRASSALNNDHTSADVVDAADDVSATSALDDVPLSVVVIVAADDGHISVAVGVGPVAAAADKVVDVSVVEVVGTKHPPTGQSLTEVAANMPPE
jgi:hypothetical protein